MKKYLSCTTATLLAIASPLFAQDGPPGGGPGGGRPGPGGNRPVPPLVAALDANKDGVIDASELAKATELLKTLDKNGDGKLTEDEYRPQRPGGPGGPDGQGGPGGQRGPGGPGGQGGGPQGGGGTRPQRPPLEK